MTILQDDEGLTLISPVQISAALRREINALGRVHTIVAPNRLHYRYFNRARDHFPDACGLAAIGLKDKRPELKVDGELSTGPLSSQIEGLLVEGADELSEVVLLHRPSHSLILTDLVFNIHSANWLTEKLLSWGSRAFGQVEQSRLFRAMVSDREASRASVEKLLAFPFSRLIPAHGDIVEDDAKEQLSQGLWWMRGLPKRPIP
jgi:hypothetical protein